MRMLLPTQLIRLLLDVLLRHLPEDKRRKYKRILLMLCLTPLALILMWIGIQWIGPTADVPDADPVELLNRRGSQLPDNAAEYYALAVQARTSPPFQGWKDHCSSDGKEVDQRLVDWLESNPESIELTRQASALGACYFDLHRSRSGLLDLFPIRGVRDQAKFISLRARLATQRGDYATLRDSLSILGGMADHLATYPGVLGDLASMGVRGTALELSVRPLQQPDSFDVGRDELLELPRAWLNPLASCMDRLDFERADACWILANATITTGAWWLPKRRLAAEVDRAMAPYFRLAVEPLDVQMTPYNRHWQEIDRLRSWPRYWIQGWFNVARGCGAAFIRLHGYFELRAAFTLHQRAVRLIVAVHEFEAEQGRLPSAMDELDHSGLRDDPFSGKSLRYQLHPNDTGWTVYSLGVDRDDDGGHHNSKAIRWPGHRDQDEDTEGDYVFWPIQDDDL